MRRTSRLLAGLALALAIPLGAGASRPDAAAGRPRAPRLAELWQGLASPDAGVAYGAGWRLAQAGGADAFLARRLRPVIAVPAARRGAALLALGSDDYLTRRRAERDLEAMGEAVAEDLLRLARGPGDLERALRAGRLLGRVGPFVRTTGCNLRCAWCDSPYTSWQPEGDDLSLDEIVARMTSFRCRHSVVTGGEPLLAPGIDELCRRLREANLHITIETAATVFKPVACDLASLSPKLSNSTPRERDGGRFAAQHDRLRLQPAVIRQFLEHAREHQLKFVIDRPEDVDEVLQLLDQLPPVAPDRVLLMPQGVSREALAERGPWVAEACKHHGFRFCPRLHIDLYGNTRGT